MSSESSKAAFERARMSMGGGVGSGLRASMRPHPLFVREARGAHLWDLDGDRYVDYVMGWGPILLGHGDPRIAEPVAEALRRMQVVGTGHVDEYLAAEAVLAAVPHGERLLWSNTGTEAVQVALRLARAATGRRRIVKFTKSYHGWHDTVYASLGEHDTTEKAVPASRGQSPTVLEDLVIARFNDAAEIGRILSEADARDLAAVLVDPIMSNAGVVAPTSEFLNALRDGCSRHGVVLIFDEVIAGFRIARGGASELYGVAPDLSVFGKSMAGGLTQSAVVGRAELVDQVADGVAHAGTFNGNPIAMAAVRATMAALEDPAVYDQLERIGAYFEQHVSTAIEATCGAGAANLSRIGAFMQLVPATGSPGLHGTGGIWGTILEGAVRRGVLFAPSGKIFLTAAHSTADVDLTAEAIQAKLEDTSL